MLTSVRNISILRRLETFKTFKLFIERVIHKQCVHGRAGGQNAKKKLSTWSTDNPEDNGNLGNFTLDKLFLKYYFKHLYMSLSRIFNKHRHHYPVQNNAKIDPYRTVNLLFDKY